MENQRLENKFEKTNNLKASEAKHFYLSGDKVLYKILPERFSAEDYNQWRQLLADAPGYPKNEYKQFAPRIFERLRSCLI